MSWILPTRVPKLRTANVRTHLLDAPPQAKREQRTSQKVMIKGRTYDSIASAARQYRRHHSVIQNWLRQGKAKYV